MRAVMESCVVQKHRFPHQRRAQCCSRTVKQGDSVLVLPLYNGDEMVTTVILHRRCLARFMEGMPEDASKPKADFDSLRSAIVRSGTAFPKRKVG